MNLRLYFEMPQFIQNTKTVLNRQNNDKYCFLWSIAVVLILKQLTLFVFLKQKNIEEVSLYVIFIS